MTMPALLSHRRLFGSLSVLLALTLALVVLSLCVGSTSYRPWQLLDNSEQALIARDVILELRLPRTLAALAVGGLLALAGALQQLLLRNALADPYVLGTSGGASVGALSAMFLGAGAATINLAAASGAFLTMLLVFVFAGRDYSSQQARLLLTGVALASFFGALSSLLLTIAPESLLRGMIFWLLGDLAGAQWQLAMATLLGLLMILTPFARELNLLSLGQQPAHALGAQTRHLQWLLYFVAAIATAIAVTTAGMIGFVGLIVPHALRLLLGQDQRLLLPACALGGGMILLAADIGSRVAFAPVQLPVGIITALLGAPAFLWLLRIPYRSKA